MKIANLLHGHTKSQSRQSAALITQAEAGQMMNVSESAVTRRRSIEKHGTEDLKRSTLIFLLIDETYGAQRLAVIAAGRAGLFGSSGIDD